MITVREVAHFVGVRAGRVNCQRVVPPAWVPWADDWLEGFDKCGELHYWFVVDQDWVEEVERSGPVAMKDYLEGYP